MDPLRQRFPITILVCTLVGMAACSSGQEPPGSAPLGFYAAPDGGPAPLDVHFHFIGDETIVNAMKSWAWDFGDGESATEGYTSHTYANEGTYTVTLTYTMPNGDTHKVTREAYIRAAAEARPSEEQEAPAGGEAPEEGQVETEAEIPGEMGGEAEGQAESGGAGNGAVFIHHSCGENWLNSGLHDALLGKDYIDDRNGITYGTEVRPDRGRPASLGPVPGELTDMCHWIPWFNDYFEGIRTHGCRGGFNRIVLFKSCFPNSHVDAAGGEPGDPFSDWRTVANYKAVYRHPGGPGKTYEHDGHVYRPLRDIFAQHPDTLFIPITAPPECWQEASSETAAFARAFNTWLREEWLPGYIRDTKLRNVAVFDWFDVLAAPASAPSHPNQLRAQYGGNAGDSHPNEAANAHSTRVFAGSSGSFLDKAWAEFTSGKPKE